MVTPKPKKMEERGCRPVRLPDLVIAASDDQWAARAAAELSGHILEQGGKRPPVIAGAPIRGRIPIRLCAGPADGADRFFGGGFFGAGAADPGFQSYRMTGSADGGVVVQGLRPQGVYWGMKTLKAMLRFERGRVLLPLADVLDGADMEDRGIWIPPLGGPTCPFKDGDRILAHYRRWIDWMSDRKMNLVEVMTVGWGGGIGFRSRRHADLQREGAEEHEVLLRETIRHGSLRGVKVVPIFTHPEHLGFIAEKDPSLRPAHAVRHHGGEIRPGIDFFKPEAARILTELAEDLVEAVSPPDLCFWLSENRIHAQAPGRRTGSEFAREARTYAAVAESVRRGAPETGLRILLSQGSFPENADLIRSLPREVKWIYYSGERSGTYNIRSRNPIPAPIAAAARDGYWISLCNAVAGIPARPAVWELLDAGVGHAVDAGLKGVDGMSFAFPGDAASLFVVGARAWNRRGRSLPETLAAYARERGAADPTRQAEAYALYDRANRAEGARNSICVGQPFGDFSRYFNMLERIKSNERVDELIMHVADAMEDGETDALDDARRDLARALELADPADEVFLRRAEYLLRAVGVSRAAARAFYVNCREKSYDMYKGDWEDFRAEIASCIAAIAEEARAAGPAFRKAVGLEGWGRVRATKGNPLAATAGFARTIDPGKILSSREM